MFEKFNIMFCGGRTSKTNNSSKKIAVKVTDEKRGRKIGLVVSSIQELKDKAINLLFKTGEIIHNNDLFIQLEDGTEVDDDDYLLSLNSNSLLIISTTKPSPHKGELNSILSI